MPSTWDEFLYAEIKQITDQSLPTFRNESQRILAEQTVIGNVHSPSVFQKIIDHFRNILSATCNDIVSAIEGARDDFNAPASELVPELPKKISEAFDSCVKSANSSLAVYAPNYPTFSEEQRTIKADEFLEALQEATESLLSYKNRRIGF